MTDIVKSWDVETVTEFFQGINLSKYERDLKKGKIDGLKLLAFKAKGGGIKGIKNKDDIRKIQQELDDKIAALDADQQFTYDGFLKDEFDDEFIDDSDSSDEYIEPEQQPPEMPPPPAIPPRRPNKPQPPLPDEEDEIPSMAPPALPPRREAIPPPVLTADVRPAPSLPPTRQQRAGFVGKAPPKVPVIKMNLQSPRNKVQEKQPSQQPQQEEFYEELDDKIKPSFDHSQLDKNEDIYEGEDYEVADNVPCHPKFGGHALPTNPAPKPPRQVTKQKSVPTQSTQAPDPMPSRSNSEKSRPNSTKFLGIDTVAIRKHKDGMRTTSVKDIDFEALEQKPKEGQEVDPSSLSVQQRKMLFAPKDHSLTLPPGFKPPSEQKQRKISDSTGPSPNTKAQTSPRRPPEPLPKTKKQYPGSRDSGVSLTSNSSSRSQQQQQQQQPDRDSISPLARMSTISSDSSFSDSGSFQSSHRSEGVENSSGITVVTRPSYKNKYHQSNLESLEWFHGHLKDRKEGEIKLKKFSSGEDGVFLVRTSNKSELQPYTLMLMYQKQVKNLPICVRPNRENRFALGQEKPNEELFHSVEALIRYHRHNDIILSGPGEGSVKLSLTPPKL